MPQPQSWCDVLPGRIDITFAHVLNVYTNALVRQDDHAGAFGTSTTGGNGVRGRRRGPPAGNRSTAWRDLTGLQRVRGRTEETTETLVCAAPLDGPALVENESGRVSPSDAADEDTPKLDARQ